MQKFGIDVSRWQGNFDFARAKRDEKIEFAILKIGGGDDGLYMDRQFENNYKKCIEAGLDKGVYFFGHAMSMEEAKKEAAYFIELLKDKKFEYPVFYDVEADMLSLGKDTLTNICLYVLQTVQAAGYWVGIYTSQSQFNNEVYDAKLKGYSHWVARYAENKPVLTSGAEVQMWQFGGETNFIRSKKINGITVDQNYCYVDYPTLIKAKGLNGYSKTEVPKVEVPKEEVKKPATTYKAGQVLQLDDAPLYNTATTDSKAGNVSGTYYLWSNEVINNRIRITNTLERVGDPNQVTGFISVARIKSASASTTTSTESYDERITRLAKEVWVEGKHGKGAERKKALGADYDAVQKKIEELYY